MNNFYNKIEKNNNICINRSFDLIKFNAIIKSIIVLIFYILNGLLTQI